MIIHTIKFLNKSMKFINQSSQYLSNKISYNFSSPVIYNNLNLNTISEKWNVQFCYLSNPMKQDQNKIRPVYGSKSFIIRLVQRTMQYVKGIFIQLFIGRPSYSIDMNCMDTLKFAYWNHKYGKFNMIVSNSYKQQVFTIQKIVKKYQNTNHTEEQFSKSLQSPVQNQNNTKKINNLSNLQQQQAKFSFKFSFYVMFFNYIYLNRTIKNSYRNQSIFLCNLVNYNIYNKFQNLDSIKQVLDKVLKITKFINNKNKSIIK